MKLQVEPETPEQEVTRLRHELSHVSEQTTIAHHMAMSWRQRCLASEEQCRRLQKKFDRKQAKDTAPEEDISTDEALSLPEVW